MESLIKRFLRAENGATAIEYGIILALLSLTIIGAVSGLGQFLYNYIGAATNAINH
jgi:pilus assembly protein Flp/PilA